MEFPGEGDALGGYIELPRESFTIVIDRQGQGPISFVEAGEDE